VPPIVALFLVGIFWKGANADGANATLLYGFPCSLVLFLSNEVFGWTHMHFLYAAPLLFVLDALILIVASRMRAQGQLVDGSELLWSGQTYAAETARLRAIPLWRNYRVHALGLLALTAWLVIAFR